MTARRALLAALLLVGATVTACGGSSSPKGNEVVFPTVVTLGKGDIFPAINNQVLAVGDNRVSMSLTDRNDNPVLGAQVHLRFYDLNGPKPALRSESDARFIPMTLAYVDEQSGKQEQKSGDAGVYVTHATFDEPGDWGVQVTVVRDGTSPPPVPFRFNVLAHAPEPAIGDPAPASRQATLATVPRIEDIDSSYPPRPQMHDTTVADALASGKPIVVAFATPAFCQSRTCAPVMDTVMDPLYAKYRGQAVFIHIEPYELPQLRRSNVDEPVRAMREWNLQTEPWVFVVGRDGRVAGKFEGIMAADEVESVLVQALGGTPAPGPSPTS